MIRVSSFMLCAALAAISVAGCARSARDTTGFAMTESRRVEAAFEDTWQGVKRVLRARELEIYTRDKRGVFVAYTPQQRDLLIIPRRTQFTITLSEIMPSETEVEIETLDQVYGVTLLTQPDWHDRKTADASLAVALLDDLERHLAGEPMPLPDDPQETEIGEAADEDDEGSIQELPGEPAGGAPNGVGS